MNFSDFYAKLTRLADSQKKELNNLLPTILRSQREHLGFLITTSILEQEFDNKEDSVHFIETILKEIENSNKLSLDSLDEAREFDLFYFKEYSQICEEYYDKFLVLFESFLKDNKFLYKGVEYKLSKLEFPGVNSISTYVTLENLKENDSLKIRFSDHSPNCRDSNLYYYYEQSYDDPKGLYSYHCQQYNWVTLTAVFEAIEELFKDIKIL